MYLREHYFGIVTDPTPFLTVKARPPLRLPVNKCILPHQSETRSGYITFISLYNIQNMPDNIYHM